MDAVKASAESAMAFVEAKLQAYEGNPVITGLDLATEKTGLPRAQIAAGSAVSVALLMILLTGMGLVATLVGVVYPSIRSFKAMEGSDEAEKTTCLSYWAVYGVFTVLSNFSDMILFWFPVYYEFKIAFLIWCQYPSPNSGATVVYNKVIRPYFFAGGDAADEGDGKKDE